jgi:two-component system sensor histidine kinase KdpD
MSTVRVRTAAACTAEVLAAVGVATGAVALLKPHAPVSGLGAIYLLAVLLIAIRRGLVPALATSVLSVLVLNYFFIEPLHRLTISDSENVMSLVVFAIAAVVVGRLAAAERDRASEAESRAQVAAAREREAALLAEVASSLLADSGAPRGDGLGPALASALDRSGARIALSSAPSPGDHESAVRLPTREGSVWLYTRDFGLERLAEPLAKLVDLALERRRLSRQAEQADAVRRADVAKTAVLHAISHDLRSPLTAIATASAALRPGGLSDQDRAELVAVIEAEAARLGRLVDDLLDLSRIEAGAADPRPDWCDLRDVVAGAAEQVRRQVGELRLETDLPGELPLVRVDSVQAERVFANLIENAVKFSPAGAAVRISGGVGGGHVTVRVSNRGQGIPAGDRLHVFEPFFHGRDGRKGSGLGLAICRGFVEANGGRIRVQSRPGEGTSFAVSFPLVEQPLPAQ